MLKHFLITMKLNGEIFVFSDKMTMKKIMKKKNEIENEEGIIKE